MSGHIDPCHKALVPILGHSLLTEVAAIKVNQVEICLLVHEILPLKRVALIVQVLDEVSRENTVNQSSKLVTIGRSASNGHARMQPVVVIAVLT